MNDLAWVLFTITCVALSGRLLYTVARAKLTPRQEWSVEDGEAGEFEVCPPTQRNLAPAQMRAHCAYAQPDASEAGSVCYCRCEPGCRLYTPSDGYRPIEATEVPRRMT